MSHNGFEENKFDFDATTTRVLEGFSQRVSRRSMITRVGKLALSLLGVSAFPLLPFDRVMRSAKAQSGTCAQWHLCGINGRLCNSCTCAAGTVQSCPRCTYQGALWRMCCPVRVNGDGAPTGEWKTVEYIDCCGQQGTCTPTNNAGSCDGGTICSNNPGSGLWCQASGAPVPGKQYHCTHARILDGSYSDNICSTPF